MQQTSLTLDSGAAFPAVGQGFWKVPNADAARVAVEAIEVGYRHFDCACDYGNEREVGEGISKALESGMIRREELFVTSKLWNTYHDPEHVRPAIERSLRDLGLDYLDLYLVHFPIAQAYVPFETRYPPGWFFDPDVEAPRVELANVPLRATWEAMEAVHRAGLAKHIGVCNFTTGLLRDFINDASIAPSVLQVETHPFLAQPKLLRFCQENGIAYTAFSPLGAQSYYELGMADPSDSLLEHSVMKDIAATHGRTAAQIALRWGVQRGTSVIPKTARKERLVENLSVFDFALSDDEMGAIDSLDQHRRYNDPGVFGEAAFNTFLPIYD